ncbi:MAG TPA: glycosyltransferase family 39 protein [Candidatus Hydrogenedentes bacterium]|nr:glycosyltransferase family 39 protein [Candidatus Hydrogenedentota bacterium]
MSDYITKKQCKYVTDALAAGFLLAQVFLWRLPAYRVLPFSDGGHYAFVARRIINGMFPYRDIYDHKPPGIYYIHGLFIAIFGDISLALWIEDVLLIAITAVILFVYMRKYLSRDWSLLYASLYIVLVNATLYFYFQPGWIEIPAALFLLSAYLLTMESKTWKGHACAGIAVACCVMTQQTAILTCLPIWIWLLARRDIKACTAHFAAIILLAVCFCFWYAAMGVLDEFLYFAVFFNRYYVQENLPTLDIQRFKGIAYLLTPFLLVIYLVPFGVRRFGTKYVLLLMWTISAVTIIPIAGKRMYSHYFINWAIPLTLVMGLGWAARQEKGFSKPWAIVSGMCVVLFFLALSPALEKYSTLVVLRWRTTDIHHFRTDLPEVLDYLKRNPLPNENKNVLFFGKTWYELSLVADVDIPTAMTGNYPWVIIDHPRREEFIKRWDNQVKLAKPPLLILLKTKTLPSWLSSEMKQWFQDHYILAKTGQKWDFFVYKETINGKDFTGVKQKI